MKFLVLLVALVSVISSKRHALKEVPEKSKNAIYYTYPRYYYGGYYWPYYNGYYRPYYSPYIVYRNKQSNLDEAEA